MSEDAKVEWLPALKEDGTWTHSDRAPIPECKVAKYIAWEDTREPHAGSASGASRQREARRKKVRERRQHDRQLADTVAMAKDQDMICK